MLTDSTGQVDRYLVVNKREVSNTLKTIRRQRRVFGEADRRGRGERRGRQRERQGQQVAHAVAQGLPAVKRGQNVNFTLQALPLI